jgi:SAM-dependent methyltransferase
MIAARGGSLDFDDGRPMPSAYLVALVTGVADRRWFSEGGERDADTFRALAVRHGIDIASRATVLDFGCGCGRIARWLAPDVMRGGGAFVGLDINSRLLRWCANNLPGVIQRNNLKAPMPVATGSVDLLYAHSVVTRAFFSDLCGRRLEVCEIIPGVPEHGLQAIAVLRNA